MVSGDTAADKSVSGYVTAEQIALSVTPTGTSYVWALAKPSGATSRSDLSANDEASCVFTPDVAGNWTVSLTVDSTTTYVIRIAVTAVAVSFVYEALRFTPKLNSTVPTPTIGAAVFFSDDSDLLSRKSPAGVVRSLEPRAFTPSGTADTTGVTGEWGYDSDYVYVKTAGGWKRAALASF